jgi:hypothetical protein
MDFLKQYWGIPKYTAEKSSHRYTLLKDYIIKRTVPPTYEGSVNSILDQLDRKACFLDIPRVLTFPVSTVLAAKRLGGWVRRTPAKRLIGRPRRGLFNESTWKTSAAVLKKVFIDSRLFPRIYKTTSNRPHFQEPALETRYTKLKKILLKFPPGPPKNFLLWDSLPVPGIKNSFESSYFKTAKHKMSALFSRDTFKNIESIFAGNIFNNNKSNSSKPYADLKTVMHSKGSTILNEPEARQDNRTSHAEYLIQNMKKIIKNNRNDFQTINRVDSVRKDIRAANSSQDQLLDHISKQLVDMNRKIDIIHTAQRRTETLNNSARHSKDGGFYDY